MSPQDLIDWLRLGLEFVAFVAPIMAQLYALHRRNVQRFDQVLQRMDHLDDCMDRTRRRVRRFERQRRRQERKARLASQGSPQGAPHGA